MEVKGVPRPVSLRHISALQLRRCLRKKCQVYAAYVKDTTSKESSQEIDAFLVLQEFVDVFQEVPGLPPRREVDFSIDLVPGVVPISKTPYRMGTFELKEL